MAELYHFYYGSEVWRFNSGQSDLSVGGHTYVAESISRSEIQWDIEKQEAAVEMPMDTEPASLFTAFNPSSVLWVEIMNSSGTPIFVGKVVGCSFNIDEGKASLKLVSIQTIFQGKIPDRTYGTSCPWEVFSTGCKLSGPTYAISVPVDEITKSSNGRELTHVDFAAKLDGYFTGGYLTLSYETAYIVEHISGKITLLFPLMLWTSGLSVIVYPGCDKTLATCKSKFNNVTNFGGCPFIPTQNIMTQGF